ncbi:MAG: CbiX/SirB N-terminal domain-containing protein [bacterium]|nr:CbiX/SirB N-terminal domain-containing protein [bacterium]
MKNRPKNALILLGHGSHISPNTAGVVWDAVDRLRERGVADEITASFWKEHPSFHTVLKGITANDITLVPLFTAQGYFTQTVIPTEMNLSGAMTIRDGRTIRYAPPPVFHPKLTEIVRARITDAVQQHNLSPQHVAIAIIGHSTRKNAKSRESTENQATLLRNMGIFGDVLTAFLDDDPEISTIYARTSQPTIIAVPLFLAMGSHTTIDVPEALGLSPNTSSAVINGKKLIYTPAIGEGNDLTDLIIDLARAVDAPLNAPNPQKTVWGCFPRGGWERLQTRLTETSELQIGELIVTHEGVRVFGDEAPTHIIKTPAELRALVRENPFRPLSTAKGLPRGWIAPAQSLDEVCAIIETVYPNILPYWDDKKGDITPFGETIARQKGIYRPLAELDEASIGDVTTTVCSACIRTPTWHTGAFLPIMCDEACNWWLSNASKRIEIND